MKDKLVILKDVLKIIISILIIFTCIKSCSRAEFSEADIKNVIYNYSNYRGKTAEEVGAWFQTTNYQTFFEDFLSLYINNPDYDFCAATTGNYILNIAIQATNHTKTIVSANLSNGAYIYYYKLFTVNTNNGDIQINPNTNYDKAVGSRGSTCYVYTYHFDIYQATNSTNITYTAPYNNLQYLTPNGPYTDDWLWGIADHLTEQCYLSGDNVQGILGSWQPWKSLYNSIWAPSETWSVAFIGGAQYYDYTQADIYRYNTFNHTWYLAKTITTTSAWGNDNDGTFLYLPINYYYADSLISIKAYANNEYPPIEPYYIYTISNYTVINNSGDIDILATINNYPTGNSYEDNTRKADDDQTNQNIQDIADNIAQQGEEAEERDSWWREKIDRLVTPSGEVVKQIFQDTLQNIQIESGEILADYIVLTMLSGEPRRF